MNRTTGILISAAVLALVAVLLSRKDGAPPPPAPPAVVSTGSVNLNALPSGTHVLHQGTGEMYLNINLNAPTSSLSRRLPVNLGLVIDRSGSMAGQKLMHARQAATQLVNRLKDGDRIAVITYGSDVTLLVPSTVISSATRGQIARSIDSITDRGGTFLSGGLESGRDEVLRHGRKGFVNRVILISDGRANEGLTSRTALTSLAQQTLGRGVHLTTMGVGLDFNEEVMTAMAEHGGGHYYFVQNSAAMAKFFDQELETMTSIVGKGATLKLTLHPNVELLDIYGYTFTRNGSEVRVRLPDIFGGQQRKMICKLRVPTSREGKLSVATVELMYQDPDSHKKQAVVFDARIVVTSDTRAVEKNRDRAVMANVEQVQAAASITRAMKAYERGDVAMSKQLLRRQISRTRTANKRLRSGKLDNLLGAMEGQVAGTAAAPASSAGRALIKRSKYKAYKLAK